MVRGLAVGVLVACSALATQAQQALPTVEQVLTKYVTGLGGRAALEKLHTRTWKGTLELPDGTTAAVTYQAKAPGKRRYTIQIREFRLADQSFNGTSGWSNNSQDGLRDLGEDDLVAERLNSDFYAPLNFQKSYSELKVTGVEKVGAVDTYVMEGKQPDGHPRVMYFDVASGLLVRFIVERNAPEGLLKIDNYWEDYRAVDGVQVPHLLRQESPDFVIITRVSEVQHNLPIEDSVFEKPAGSSP